MRNWFQSLPSKINLYRYIAGAAPGSAAGGEYLQRFQVKSSPGMRDKIAGGGGVYGDMPLARDAGRGGSSGGGRKPLGSSFF
jgi:hypothetical protein